MWWNNRIVRFRTGHFVVYDLMDAPVAFTLVMLAEFAEYMATVHHEELVHYQPAGNILDHYMNIPVQVMLRVLPPPVVSMFKATPAFGTDTAAELERIARSHRVYPKDLMPMESEWPQAYEKGFGISTDQSTDTSRNAVFRRGADGSIQLVVKAPEVTCATCGKPGHWPQPCDALPTGEST